MSNPAPEEVTTETVGASSDNWPETTPTLLIGDQSPPAAGEYHRLEPDVIALWRLNGAIEWVILLGLAFLAITIGSIILALGMWFWPLLAAWVLVAILAIAQTIWYPPLAYRHYGYRIAERVIEVRHGVWFRESRLVPLSRIQHVDLRQGLFERSYGLATLVFHTAGMHESSTVLPGLALATATDLRDRLMAQIHGGRPLRHRLSPPVQVVSEAEHGG